MTHVRDTNQKHNERSHCIQQYTITVHNHTAHTHTHTYQPPTPSCNHIDIHEYNAITFTHRKIQIIQTLVRTETNPIACIYNMYYLVL